MELKTDYSDIKFAENGKLKLLIIVGTRPEIIRLAAVINKTSALQPLSVSAASISTQSLLIQARTMTIT